MPVPEVPHPHRLNAKSQPAEQASNWSAISYRHFVAACGATAGATFSSVTARVESLLAPGGSHPQAADAKVRLAEQAFSNGR